MSASELAKQLGATSLTEVAEFHGTTTQTLRRRYEENRPSFIALVLGFKAYQAHERINDHENQT
ncbi:hypothetical protein BCS93_11180 [Vibrio breoganii]|uniref:Uncharacterized protein n=1 Tax=Vibrio breoganii TaxID=553239 RepID=A0AAP8MVS7_9VIBR|nr:hypothetical protein BCS93_11180 [Vibrio breoganii]